MYCNTKEGSKDRVEIHEKASIAATLRLPCAQPQWKWQTVRATRATAGESAADQLRVKVKVENSVGSLGHWQWTVWAVGAHCWTVDSGHFHCVSCATASDSVRTGFR